MNINLNSRIALTNERAESSYGIPVLVIDGIAYGKGDDYSAIYGALDKVGVEFLDNLAMMCTKEQHLSQLCTQHSGYGGEAHKALAAFQS